MKRLTFLCATSLILTAPALAAPGDMSAATFLAKADALKARGIGALGSPDIKVLRSEGQAAGEAYRQRLQAERAQGRPSSCPPTGAKVSSDKLLAHLRTYPEPVRAKTSMKQAMADYFIRNFPCR
jgi:hypothetical protein